MTIADLNGDHYRHVPLYLYIMNINIIIRIANTLVCLPVTNSNR